MNDNIQKLYGALQKYGYNDLGTADEFGAKVQDENSRKKLYDALSRDGFNDLGTYEEFSGRLVQAPAQAAPAQAPAAQQEQTAQAAPANPVPQDNTRWAVPRASQFGAQMDELGRSVMPGEPVSMPEKGQEAVAEPEGNPFPNRGSLEQELEDLRERRMLAEENVKPDLELISEYDRRLKEFHQSLDPTSKKTKENEKWLREHKHAYEAAKNGDNMKEYASAKAAYDETARAMGSAMERIAQRKNREEMASPAEVVATGKTALGNDNVGRKDTEYMYRKLADELYQSADKEYGWSSKNDEGYSGSPLERVWTAAEQFVSDAGNNIDSGSLTLGLSKGLAMEKSREVGEKYNGIIDKTLKDMKMSDGDIQSVLSSIESNGTKLQSLEDELNAATSEIDAMNATYEDMVRSGDPGAEAYGKTLQEKIDAYNRRVNEEYKPLFDKYDGDRKAYEQVMSAIDAAVESGLTGGEKALLDALEKFTEAKTLSEPVRSTASKAGAGAEQSAEFMLDFILTGGIAKAGTKAATKLATKRALKKFGAEALKDMAVKPGLGLRLATDAAVSGLRTAAVFPRTLQAYGENATEYSGKDYAGRIDFDRTQANALGNSLLTQFIEYWSEGFGEYFGEAEQALFKSVTKQAPREMIGKTLRNYRGSIGQYLDKGKFDGMFNEMLEEVVGSGLNALSGWLSGDRVGDADAMKEFFSGENIATLALSFLPMSAISAATNVSAYHKMKQRYDEGVAMLNPFIESGAISRKELEQLSKDIPNLTPNEIKDRVVDIADRARKSNEGHLPKDFAKNLLGYLEGDFAMSLRNDQWEDSQEKMSVVNSYATMYANPDPRYAWDIQQEENEARAAAEEAGFTQDELDLDSYQLAQQAMEMRNLEPERADALMGYANAKAALEGLENGYREQGEQIARANEEEIRSNLDVNGNVVTAVVTEYGAPKVAYITSDDVTIAPDGTVTTPTGNGVVKYRTYENGEYGPESTIMSDKVSEAQAVPTDQYIRMENDAILNGRNELYEQAKRTVSPTGQSRAISQRIGMNVVIRGNGAYQPVRVERMTDDGMKVVISGDKDTLKGVATAAQVQTPGGKYLEIDVTRLWPLLDKEADDVTLTTFEPEAKEEAGAEQAAPAQEQAQAPQVNPDELPDTTRTIMFKGKPTQVTVSTVGGDGVWFTYRDEAGNELEGDMPLEDFMNSIVADEAPAAVEEAPVEAPAQEQAPAFPVDENGNRIYDHPSVSPERAYRELMTGIEPGSKNEANRVKYIASKANRAAQAVADAENKIAGIQAKRDAVDEWEIGEDEELDAFENRKDAKKAEYDAEMAKVQDQMAELQRKAAHWAAIRDMAAGVASVRRDAALVARAEAWTKRTGIKVKICRTPEEVDDKSVKKALAKGEIVGGWYNKKTGEVGLYLPNIPNEAEVDKTFIHEVVSHKGLEDLLGKENYDALCDKVWEQLMSEAERQEFLAYNSHLKGDEQFLRRAAADEWIARYSETLGLERNRNLFDKFVDFVKEFLDRILGEDAKISKDDIATLLRSSLARYESERKSTAKAKPLSTESLSPEIQAELKEKGETMDGGVVMDDLQDKLKKETGYQTPNEHDEAASPVVGDIRMSKTTITPWAKTYMTYPGAQEHVVKVLENLTERMAANELVDGVVPRGTYKYGEKSSGSFAGPLRTNIEYVVTFDMDTSCPRSLQYLEYVKMIEAQIGRPLTQRESIQLIEMMRVYGQMIPCVYCYCENKRQALKQYYTDFMTSRHAVISAKTDEEALEHMYGHATNKAAKESKDPEVVLNKAAYKVFKQWRQEKEYNPTLRQLWAQYHNDRNVVLTVLDSMLDNGGVTTTMTDDQITDAVCSYLGITDKNAQGAVGDIVSEWKWNRIEDRPHDDFTPVTEEDELVVDNRTLSLWREMTLYGKSASSAKNVLRYVPYTDELKTLSQEQRDYINGMGGLRMHSSNDFRIDYVLDYFQFMADMEVNHMMGHTYTKSPEFVRIFGNSGYKINMSIAAYEDSHGIRPNPDEGFDWATAKELREKFPNAGVMLMATSDAQIQMALDSDWIDMFIPFHHSGLPKAVWYDMRHWSDYTSKQNEKFLNGEEMRAALAEDGVEVPKGAGAAEVEKLYNDHFHIRVETYKTGKDKGKRIRPHFLPGPTVVDGVEIPGHNNDYNRYIELCREWGVHPRFYGVKVKDNTPEGGGRVVDITEHPAYMKCIKETARTDTPQTAIQFNFDQPSEALGGMTPIDYAMQELEARAAAESQMAGSPVRNIYESYKQDPYGIVPQFIKGIIKHGAEVKERTGQDLPLDYLTPDSRKWFMTERKALEEAYKDVDTIPYHTHEYDEDGNLVMEPEVQEAGDEVAEDGTWERFRKLEDQAKIEELENGEWEEDAYRAVQFIPDPNGEWEYDLGDGKGVQKGNVYPPMSAQTEKGEWRNPIQKGVIEESEEAPGKAFLKNGKWVFRLHKGNGKYVDAAYNPYIHSSDTMLNDQFSEAQSRGNLVVMRVAVPKSELDGENLYQAEKAKDHVGRHDWKAGPIQGELTGTRTVYLSRYDKPMELMPIEKVGESVAKMLEGQVETMPTNVVWPQLRAELEKQGMKFVETDNKGKLVSGENAGKTWKQVYGKKKPAKKKPTKKKPTKKQKNSDTGTRFRKANESQLGLVSNAGAALDRIKMDKATPEQWVKMLEKEGGLKAGEDKWLGLSDWLKSQDKKTITKDEIDDYIAQNRIMLMEADYAEDIPYGGSKEWNDYVSNEFGGDVLEAFNFYPGDGGTSFDFVDTDKAAEAYKRLQKEFGIEHELETAPGGEYTRADMRAMHDLAEEIAIYADSMLQTATPINDTRLGLTTDGLTNKREIAIVVPTVDPYHGHLPEIHFDDAVTGGRAVVWARFGDTVHPYDEALEHDAYVRYMDFLDEMRRKYKSSITSKMSAEEREEEDSLRRAWENARNGDKVLVIDEIQSQRHEDARDAFAKQMQKKYGDDWKDKATDEEKKQGGYQDSIDDFLASVGLVFEDGIDGYYRLTWADNGFDHSTIRKGIKGASETPEQAKKYLADAIYGKKRIPSAPFDKNWHELAMKRMLRLAAEEGYDYVAWTTGAQQADRYNMESAIGKLYASKDGEKYYVEVYDPQGKEITFNGLIGDSRSTGTYTPEELVNIFGKEGAKEIISAADTLPSEDELERLREKANASGTKEDRDAWRKASFAEIDGSELFKGEGMKGFYDDILPRFMNKYGKKWGVKVEDITLPNVEEAGRTMHAVPVTQEMKDSVMEGQTMFRKSTVTPEQDKEYMDAVNSGDMEKAQEMVDEAAKAAGYTIKAYHGTETENGERPFNVIKEGHFTDDWGFAEYYAASGNFGNAEPYVFDTYIKMENPLVYDFKGQNSDYAFDDNGEIINTHRIFNRAKEEGYDGVILNNVDEYGGGIEEEDGEYPGAITDYIPASPSQVKSAEPVERDDNGNVIPLSERFNPENNDIRFRVSNDADVRSTSANLYDAYENQNGEDKPWMSERELIDRIEAELPYGIDTKELFSKIDEYRRLDEEDFDEGRRDFSGSERDAVFQEILSGLNGLAENGRAETSKEDLEKAERIAAGERIVTEKVLDSMPEAIGAGVQRVSRNDMPAGHKSDKGYYNPETNTVSVCMENVLDERDAVATVIHETVGRKGLREIFGDQYRESMASSYAALDAEGRAWVNGYMLRNGLQPGDEGILRGMQEYMAVQAERGEGSFLDAVNDILSQAVDFSVGTEGFRFTNRELAYILRASYEHAKNPGWLDTPAGKAQDTLWKREYGINESDPNRPTDPEGPDAGTRFRRGDTGNALRDYERDMKDWRTAAVMENQNADLPVKIGYEKALKEKYGDQWSDRMKNLPENEDYLMRHNLSSSRAETESHNFMLFHFNPMLEKLREVQSKLVGRLSSADERQDAYERILDYLYAVSGLERNEWERNNGGEAKDWSGLTSLMGRPKEEWQEAEADARAMVDAFKDEVGDDALLDQLWDAVRSCTDYSLDHAYRYGLLAKDEYERLRGTDTKPRLWNFYLPLRGFVKKTAEEEYNYAGLVSTDKGNNEVVKDAKGRWTEADNPLANILNIALKEIVQGNENYARQALYRFVTNLGENSLLSVRKPWYVKDAATGKWSLAEPEEGQDIEAFEAEMKAKKERKEARQGRKGLDLGLIMASKGHRNQHLIHVKVGGEDRMIWVNGNPALARAVSGIGKEPNYRLFRAGSRVISNLFTTYSIDFTAKNLLRDSIYSRVALLVKEDQHYRWTFMKNWWQNFGFGAFAFPMVRLAAMWDSGALQRKPADKRTKREQMFIDFMTDGGQTGYTVIKSVEKIKSDIERTMRRAGKKTGPVVVPILGWYGLGVRTLNEAFELLTRFTAYQTSRDMGRTGQRAAYDAKEISVNFNRKGAQSNEGFWGQVAAYFGGTHYFYNAGIQGFDNFLRLFTSPRKGKGWIMPVTSAGIMTLGFFTPMINALLSGGGDDDDDNREAEWYWNLPEWVRRNNIVIGFKNKYLAVPLPVEFRALYGLGDLTASVFAANKYAHPTPGRVMLDAVALASSVLPVNPIEGVNGSIASASELAESAVRTAVPDLTMFFVDWVTNKDYTGRALVNKSPYNPAMPASQGAFASTPKALVEACQWIGEKTGVDVAPGLVRDFLNNYGGGYYRFAEDLSKQIFTDDTHPRRWDDVPFLSGFTGHIDEDRTITYSNTVLNTYKDLSTDIVKKMNLYSNSADISEKMAYENPDALPAKAKVQAILSGKDYELAKMYYFGMKDEDTGQTEKVVKVHQKGKSAGKQYKATVKIKIPGVSTLKKRWRDAKDAWASMPDGTAEEKAAKAQAYADMTNAWHEYYNAAADLADKLMDYDYGKTE